MKLMPFALTLVVAAVAASASAADTKKPVSKWTCAEFIGGFDYAYARQSLAATVAKAWYLGTETRQLLTLAEQAVGIYTELLELVTIRREAGKDSNLNVVDVRAQVEIATAQQAQRRSPATAASC